MEDSTIEALLREMSGDIRVIRSKAEELAAHQAIANGRLLKLETAHNAQLVETASVRGAVRFAQWTLATVLSVMILGVGIAGVVLGYVANR